MRPLPASLTVRGHGVVLRDWREEDEAALAPLFGDPDIARFSWLPPRYSRAAALAHIERLRARRAAGALLALAVTRDGDTALGNVNLVFRFAPDVPEAALGYWISPAARGHGLALAAASVLCGWGFAELGLTRIELLIAPGNAASQRVAARLGARADGHAQHARSDGRHEELSRYSLSPVPEFGRRTCR